MTDDTTTPAGTIDIAVAGGHGQIARLLTRRIAGDGRATVRSLIRDEAQSDDITADGGRPVLLDLEQADAHSVAEQISGCDAVVFAAGAGPDSGPARKETVDFGAAVTLIEACKVAGVDRYVMISSMGTDDVDLDAPADDDEDVFAIYLRAKARADRALMDSGLHWTIVRPGRLTDDEGTGTVTLQRNVDRGEIPRADVAAILAEVLARPDDASRLLVEAVGGSTPIPQAVTDAS